MPLYVRGDVALTAAIRPIASLAHRLGKSVVAEAVETEAQQQFLLSSGCDFMQGYRFGRPAPAGEFKLLARMAA